MQSKRRTSALWDKSSPALTPTLPAVPPQRPTPAFEIARLKSMLATERRRHQKLETAFSKYLAILESTCAGLREAYLSKDLPLVPSQIERGR